MMVHTSKYNLDQICVSKQKPPAQRRLNGLQLPLHPQQIIGWVAIAITTIINFIIIVPIQCEQFQDIVRATLLTLYLLHAAAHVTALLLDPAEKQLRMLSRFAVPEFDRTLHAHVIENGRCHLCNIQTSSKNTKHCSICNKCVDGFDHHCKWLNHCIGRRNYAPFLLSVGTATILSLVIALICLCDIVFYFVNPQLLNNSHSTFLNIQSNSTHFDHDIIGWTFISILTVFGLTSFGISCVLLHLCSFHIYISILGVSTYEYIVRNVDPDDENISNDKTEMCSIAPFQCKSANRNASKRNTLQMCGKRSECNRNKVGSVVNTVSDDVHKSSAHYLGNIDVRANLQTNEVGDIIHKSTVNNGSVTNLMAVIMTKVNSKNKLLFYQQQKLVHPLVQTDSNIGDVMTDLPSNTPETNDIVADIKS